ATPAQARENVSRGLRHAVARCCLRVMHLLSLRRHDPDQVRWVGFAPLSPATAGHPTRLLVKYLVLRLSQSKAALPATAVFAGLRNGRIAMTPFFVQIKCELGKSYQVANELAEAEIASEIYSTAGDYDLLVKFYVDSG